MINFCFSHPLVTPMDHFDRLSNVCRGALYNFLTDFSSSFYTLTQAICWMIIGTAKSKYVSVPEKHLVNRTQHFRNEKTSLL